MKKPRNIGIDVEPPEKTCNDPKCCWHGSLSIRGIVLKGKVKSAKSRNTVIIERRYHRFVPKYERYERKKSRIAAHNPPCINAKEGDKVIIAECRPISKTKHFVVIGFVK